MVSHEVPLSRHGVPPSPSSLQGRGVGPGTKPERQLPHDLEQMVLAGHLVEVEPGVFRRPVPRRMPSRAELYAHDVHAAVNVTLSTNLGEVTGIEGHREPFLSGSETCPAVVACGAGPADDRGAGAATEEEP